MGAANFSRPHFLSRSFFIMLNEFKNFIARGNVFDMAVGIIIGAAFTAIVNSMVGDLIMPLIGVIDQRVDFSDKFVALNGAEYANLQGRQGCGRAVITYGLFINAVINFLIVVLRRSSCWSKAGQPPEKSPKRQGRAVRTAGGRETFD
jgi:large conductance mechanosensitive channel protein